MTGLPELTIRPTTQADAEAIAAWRYPGEYAFYDADADPVDLDELLHDRGDGRFAVATGDGELVGHFQLKPGDGAVELGLGLRPDLTGRGLGASFLDQGIRFVERLQGPTRITLAVAAFNERAITVYARAGFVETGRGPRETGGATWEFVTMALDRDLS